MVSFMTLQNSMDEKKKKTIRHLITICSLFYLFYVFVFVCVCVFVGGAVCSV